MLNKLEIKLKLKSAAYFLLDLALALLMFWGSVFFLFKLFMEPVPEGKPILHEKRDGYCPETFHVAIREGFFKRRFCILNIRSKRKLSKEDLFVDPFVCRGRSFGLIGITEDPSAAPGPDGIWNLLFKIDFQEDRPAPFFSRIDFSRMCPWKLEGDSSCVVIHLNPAAREYVSRVAIPVCGGLARQDILGAEHDDPQTEAIRAERRSAVRMLLQCCAAICIAANFYLFFRYVSRSPDRRTGIRAFGRQWAVFMISVAAAFSVCCIVRLLILLSESLLRAGSMSLSGLQGICRPVNIATGAGIAVAAGAAVFLLHRRKRRGPEVRLLPWIPLLCVAAVACLAVRNQIARHYFRERFRANIYQTEDASDAESDLFDEAKKEIEE